MAWRAGKARARLLRGSPLLAILLTASLCLGTDTVVFTVVERIEFAVPGDWPVVASKSTPQKTVFAFQIPNPADAGTNDSTNLSIISSYLGSKQDKEAFDKKASSPEPGAVIKPFMERWSCSTFSAMQGSTQYVDWDCYRIVAKCGVFVRIAWPHLPKNPPDYDQKMEATLTDFLASVVPSKKLKN